MNGAHIGFAGLGRMGTAMAQRLLDDGHRLTVFNRSKERSLPLAERGAAVAASPRELAEVADVLITMLLDPTAAQAVVAHPETGMLAAGRPGQVIVEMSTIGPEAARELSVLAAGSGVRLLDAPVSGSVPAAQAGTLTTLVGGDEAAYHQVRPVLRSLTARQLYLGPSGSGATMKLALNAVLGVLNEALAEALLMAERSGIRIEDAYDALEASAVAAPYVGYKRAAFLAPGDAPVAFTIEAMAKDLDLALTLADKLGLGLPVVVGARQALACAVASGLGDADLARVIDVGSGAFR